MHAKGFALWGGVAMIVLGLLSFFPALWINSYALPALMLETSYGLFLGFFPMNILNKLILLALGIGGVLASRDLAMSIRYAQVIALLMGFLTILGLIPATNTVLGYWPLFQGQVVLHGLFVLVSAYFGFVELRSGSRWATGV